MAKLYTKRLIDRFGKENITGKKYGEVIKTIIAHNTEEVAKKIGGLTQSDLEKGLRKITKTEKRFIVPDLSEILPKRSVHIRKAAQDGKMLSDTLRDSLTKNMRDTMNQFTLKTGESRYLRRRGAKAGTINPELIKDFEVKIKDTFTNYVKKDPKLGMPKNVHEIAVTEMRSTVNNIKSGYMNKLTEENEDLVSMKKWRHNPSLSKNPRRGHSYVGSLKARPLSQPYKVPTYKSRGGRQVRTGFEDMMHPHDPEASAGNVINCNCEEEYFVRRKPSKKEEEE